MLILGGTAGRNSLEIIQLFLPTPIHLNPDLHTPKHSLLPTPEVDPELHHVAVINLPRFTLHVGGTEAKVIQESPRTRLDILNIPLPIFTPEFAMSPRDNFALEPYGAGGRRVVHMVRHAITLRVAAYADD